MEPEGGEIEKRKKYKKRKEKKKEKNCYSNENK